MTKISSKISSQISPSDNTALDYFNGAATIDEYGNETPITESMVQHACNVLQDSWTFPSIASRSSHQTLHVV